MFCWAHVRRKFHDLHLTGSPLAKKALDRIGCPFDIERAAKGLPPNVRQRIRQSRALPLIEEFAAFLEATLPRLSGKSELAVAIRYARSRWQALTRYLSGGRLEISHNAAERAIRPLALGRRNWLFAGSDRGRQCAAAIHTPIETAKLNGLSGSLPARCPPPQPRPPDQPHRRTLAWNLSRRSANLAT